MEKNKTETSSGIMVNVDKKKAGIKAFLGTLVLLIALIVAYVISHIITFQSYGFVHYETAGFSGGRQGLLITIAVLKDKLETPTANVSPAIQALFHDLEQSVFRVETKDEIPALFDATSQELSRLGVHKDVSPKILEAAKSRANEFVSSSKEKQEVLKQLFMAELNSSQAWARDATSAPALLEGIGQFKEKAKGSGYGADSKVGKILSEIMKELEADRPNRRLAAQMFTRVSDEIQGSQSLFWGHSALRWLEVIAWSLAGILLVRLWAIGKFMVDNKFEPSWNWWWWAKIIEAPLLAMGVVLALSYFELGLVSGETLGLKISLRGQPVEFIVAVSFLLGLFSDSAFAFLDKLKNKILGDERENKNATATE